MDDEAEYFDEMVVTDCPDCLGSGEVGEELACANPDAFFTDEGRHVVHIEEMEDLEDETGPDTMGLQAASDTTPPKTGGVVAYDLRENLTWPEDPIGVVCVGDNDGLAHRVSRALGGVDGPFTEQLAEQVNEFRVEAGLTDYPPNCVVGKLWALVLPPLKVGHRGVETLWLCKALGIPPGKVLTDALMAVALERANPEEFDKHEDDSFLMEYEFDMVDWLEVL